MYCIKQIEKDVFWVGGNDRRLAMFEGVYSVPKGVSYNSYLIMDEKTVLMDTVDSAVSKVFFENLEYVLQDRTLDYVVVQHMEPDHSATLFDVLRRYPSATIVCNAKTLQMIGQFFQDIQDRAMIVAEGAHLQTGKHDLEFIMAPMVHWPEVMLTYDHADKILFSADAFGMFGALNGAIYADEVNFERDYLDETRRYYTNIVGKYGMQTQNALKKVAGKEVRMLCPLHGFVWRRDLPLILNKYQQWSQYLPEKKGVVIAYASVYGNTENAAEILSSKLRERNIETVMYDVSVTPASEILSACFQYSHLVFASTTYNMGVFVSMEELLHDLASHNLQNRTVALIENGSWAPAAGKCMREILQACKNMQFIEKSITIRSALHADQMAQMDDMVCAIAQSMESM